MKWVKYILGALAVAAVLAAVAFGFAPKPVPCDTATVTRGGLEVTVDGEARTRVKDRFAVFAPLTGRIDRVALKVGDVVKAGDVITRLTAQPPAPLDARARAATAANVKAAQATRDQAAKQEEAARAELEYAASRLENLQKLLASRNTSQDSVDAAQSQHKAAQARLRSAEFAVAAAGYQVDAALAATMEEPTGAETRVEIKSPVDGRVLRVARESAGPAMVGEVLVEVGDSNSLEVVCDLLSRDAVRVKPGMKARLERWGGREALNARVRVVEPFGFTKVSALGVEEQRVNVVLDFTDGAGKFEALGDGFRVEVRVILEESLNVLKVPAGAVFTTKEGQALFLVENDHALRKLVQTGRRNGLEVEILGGVTENATVIVHPGDTVEDGKAIQRR